MRTFLAGPRGDRSAEIRPSVPGSASIVFWEGAREDMVWAHKCSLDIYVFPGSFYRVLQCLGPRRISPCVALAFADRNRVKISR